MENSLFKTSQKMQIMDERLKTFQKSKNSINQATKDFWLQE